MLLVTSEKTSHLLNISPKRASNTVSSEFVCNCKQIHFSSGKAKHTWPSAFLFESPYTVLAMNSRKVAESNGQCKRNSGSVRAVGSYQVPYVVNIQLLVFKAVALCQLTRELREWVCLLTTLLHSVAEDRNCSSLRSCCCFLPDFTVSLPGRQPSQKKVVEI